MGIYDLYSSHFFLEKDKRQSFNEFKVIFTKTEILDLMFLKKIREDNKNLHKQNPPTLRDIRKYN